MTFWEDRIIFSLSPTKTLDRPVNDSKSSFAKQEFIRFLVLQHPGIWCKDFDAFLTSQLGPNIKV